MNENIKDETAPNTALLRREFLKGAGKAAIAAPAVALILSASSKPAKADAIYLGVVPCGNQTDGINLCD